MQLISLDHNYPIGWNLEKLAHKRSNLEIKH